MDCRERSVVSGGHRLEHVEDFGAANLADNNPIRTYPQRIPEELALSDLALPSILGGRVSRRKT